MTPDEVLQTARTVAEKNGWPWEEPLLVEEIQRFVLFGRRRWRVTTNVRYVAIGWNVRVQIDDESGRVVSSAYDPTSHGILLNEDREENVTPKQLNPNDAIRRLKSQFAFTLGTANRLEGKVSAAR